jgi:hypothetical protein
MRVTRRRIYRDAVQRRDKNSNALSGPSRGASISVNLMAAKQSERGRRLSEPTRAFMPSLMINASLNTSKSSISSL